MPEAVLDWGIDLILQLQVSLGGPAVAVLNFFSFLGYEEWFLLMMPFIFWCVDARMGVRVGIYLTVSGILTAILKVYLHDPRPYWYDPRVQVLAELDPWFGIPSGHALIGIGVWGGAAASIRKNWAWIAAGFIVFMIGLSRVALGVHFPTDVIAGWLIGALLLYLMVRFEDAISGFCPIGQKSVADGESVVGPEVDCIFFAKNSHSSVERLWTDESREFLEAVRRRDNSLHCF
jgi:membrane-associated phospholipid phosphatase